MPALSHPSSPPMSVPPPACSQRALHMASLGGGLLMGTAASPMPSQSIPETTKTLLATPRPR